MSISLEEIMKRAPEGATHFSPYNDDFYKVDGQKYLYFIYSQSEWSIGDVTAPPSWIEQLVPVPKQPKPWSGPEDGLPPVGTVCEHKRVHEWQQIEVFAVKPNYNGSNTALFTYGNGCWGGCAEPSFFRAIPTPEQIRESAIRDVMDIAQVDCRVTAARLVDAGFKR